MSWNPPRLTRIKHVLIKSRWKNWLFPAICIMPYVACVIWMLFEGLIWVAQIMMAPIFMGAVLALVTYWLAQQEFKKVRRR